MTKIANNKTSAYLIDHFHKLGYTGFDLHFHSQYSMDSIANLDNVLLKAKHDRIGLSVTDHNHFKGSFLASKWRFKTAVPIIPGIEVTTRSGVHSLYYFYNRNDLKEFYQKDVKPFMKNDPWRPNITAEDLMERSEKYNCVIGMPHPYVPGLTGMMRIPITEYMKKKLSFIEGLNGYNLTKNNQKAITLAKSYRKPMTAGSDGHTVFELGSCLTFLKGESTEELLSNLKKGNSIIAGKEENLLTKLIMTIEKGEEYFRRAHKEHVAFKLTKSLLMCEYREYLRKKNNIDLPHLLRYYHY